MMFMRKMHFLAALAAFLLIPSLSQAGYIGWPCSATVTSPYGPRSSPCSGCSTFHHGIDLGAASGTYLGAPAPGSFYSWVWDSCGGNMYTISYGGGWTTRFLHCSSALDTSGSVADNQDVARSGNTGSCTTGAHLHFEVRKDGVSQSIPGSSGEWKTRNANIPKDYPGLNNTSSGNTYTIDNSSAGFSVVGSWATASSAADKYGADYRYKSTAPVSEPASWSASVASGTYNIYAWWSAGTNRSTAAPYILPGNSTGTPMNQQANGGKWNLVGSKSLSGTATTKLSCWATTGYVVIADAIRYQN
jgi:hypothetical protein